MMGLSDFVASGVAGILFLVLLSASELCRRRLRVPPEWTRKLVHVCGGLICLSFPFFIRSPWIVLGMGLAMTLLFVAAFRCGRLDSLSAVRRETHGSEYFPLAVALVFWLTQGQPWFYVCSVLVLALADAGAALVGGGYGRIRYEVDGNFKSLEGSVTFLFLAFLAIQIPLLLMTDLPKETVVLSALLVAILMTGFEAVSMGGTDNLFVPLGVCVILPKITSKPLDEIVYQCISLTLMLALVGWAVRRSRAFNTGAMLVLILFGYGAWSLGSEAWSLPVFLGVAAYLAARWFVPLATGEVKARAVFRLVVFPLLFLVTANMAGEGVRLFGPFVLSLTIALMIALRRHAVLALPGSRWTGGAAVLASWLIIPVITAFSTGTGHPSIVLTIGVLTGGALALMAWRRPVPGSPAEEARYLMLMPLGGLALVWLETAGWVSPWIPR